MLEPSELAIVDELLEAHLDTIQLALETPSCSTGDVTLRWRSHVDYLQTLQRQVRALLAARSSSVLP